MIQLEGQPIGTHPLVQRLLRGIFHSRPALPRYQNILDPSLVLDMIRKWSPVKDLSLERLTKKLLALMALISAQRVQTLHFIEVPECREKSGIVTFRVDDLVTVHSQPASASVSIQGFSFRQEIVRYNSVVGISSEDSAIEFGLRA